MFYRFETLKAKNILQKVLCNARENIHYKGTNEYNTATQQKFNGKNTEGSNMYYKGRLRIRLVLTLMICSLSSGVRLSEATSNNVLKAFINGGELLERF